MNEFIITLFILVVETIGFMILLLKSISLKNKNEERAGSILAIILDFIMIIVTYTTLTIPAPEIYPSNGQISEDGSVNIHAQNGLTIYYTLNADQDPQNNGKIYKDAFKMKKSATINAKTNFLTKWSDCVTLDLIVGKDGSIDGKKTEEPGTSIKSITASWNTNNLYTGMILNNDNIKVEGKTINGNIVSIKNFNINPNIAMNEGKNIFNITYENLKTTLEANIYKPKLVSIEAKFIGNNIKEGSTYKKEQFSVIGKYEDGARKEISDFKISPKIVEKEGSNIVTISKNKIIANVKLNAKPADVKPLSSAILVRPEGVQGYMVNSNHETLLGEGFPNDYIATSVGLNYKEVISACSYTPFELIYNLKGKYNKLSGKIAFDDISNSKNDMFGIKSEFQGEAEIIFYVDNKISKKLLLTTSDFPKKFSINVSDCKKLSIKFNFPYYNFVLDNFTKYFNLINCYLRR